MKRNRWILFPFIFGIAFGLYFAFLRLSSFDFLIGFSLGCFAGLILQFISDYKTRKVKSDATEKDFGVRQKRSFVLFYNYDQTFELCLESIYHLQKGKLKHKNHLEGLITAKTGMNWQTFGNTINYSFVKITESTTEVEVTTSPILSTTLVDYGEGLKTIEALKKFFDSKNEEVNRKLVEAKQNIPINNVSLSQKDEVKNP